MKVEDLRSKKASNSGIREGKCLHVSCADNLEHNWFRLEEGTGVLRESMCPGKKRKIPCSK